MNLKNVFVMHDKTAYGEGIAEYFQMTAKSQGMKVAGFTGTEEKANFDAILSPVLRPSPTASTSAACSTRPPCSSSRPGRRASRACACPTTVSTPRFRQDRRGRAAPGHPHLFSTVSGPAGYPEPSSWPTSRPSSATTRNLRRTVLRRHGHPAKAIENAAKATRQAPARDRSGQGGPRPGSTQRHHRHHHPRRQRRPRQGPYFVVQVSRRSRQWAANNIHQTSTSLLPSRPTGLNAPPPLVPRGGFFSETLCASSWARSTCARSTRPSVRWRSSSRARAPFVP